MQLPIWKLQEFLILDKETSRVFRRLPNAEKGRELLANPDGIATIYDRDTKKNVKMKMKVVVWSLCHGWIPAKSVLIATKYKKVRIFHLNMQEDDFRMYNLGIILEQDYKLVKNAYRNVSEYIKFYAHPNDQFSYITRWLENGIQKTKVHPDIEPARKHATELKLKYTKILTKFCKFDEIL